MDLQAEAERRKRAEILESEGNREAAINTARGAKETILLKAQGEAAGIIAKARATGAWCVVRVVCLCRMRQAYSHAHSRWDPSGVKIHQNQGWYLCSFAATC